MALPPTSRASARRWVVVCPSLRSAAERVNGVARRLADGLRAIIAYQDLGYPVTQCASMVDLKFRHGAAHRDMAESREADAAAYARFYHAMLHRGVLLPPSQMELMFLTGAHSDSDIDFTLQAASDALR